MEGSVSTATSSRGGGTLSSSGSTQWRPWRSKVTAGFRATFRRRGSNGSTEDKIGTAERSNFMEGEPFFPLGAEETEGGSDYFETLGWRRHQPKRRNSTGGKNMPGRRIEGDRGREGVGGGGGAQDGTQERREGNVRKGNGASSRPRRRNSAGPNSSSYLQSLRSESRERRYGGPKHHMSRWGGVPRTPNRNAGLRGRGTNHRRGSRTSEMGEGTVASTDTSADFSVAENSKAWSLPETYHFRRPSLASSFVGSLPPDYARRPSTSGTILSNETSGFSLPASNATVTSNNSAENHHFVHPLHPTSLPMPPPSFVDPGVSSGYVLSLPQSYSPAFQDRAPIPVVEPPMSPFPHHFGAEARTAGPSSQPAFAPPPLLPRHAVIDETDEGRTLYESAEDDDADASFGTNSSLEPDDQKPHPPLSHPPLYIDTDHVVLHGDGMAKFINFGSTPLSFQPQEAMPHIHSHEPSISMVPFTNIESQVNPSLDRLPRPEEDQRDSALTAAMPVSTMETKTPSIPAQLYEPSQEASITFSSAAEGTTSTAAGDNLDETALILSESIKTGNSKSVLNLARSLVERANLVESINWLGNHVPGCVLSCLSEEINIIMRAERTRERRSKKKRGRRNKKENQSALEEKLPWDGSDEEPEAHDYGVKKPLSQMTGPASNESPLHPLPPELAPPPNRPKNLLIRTFSRNTMLVKHMSVRSEITVTSGGASVSDNQLESDEDNDYPSGWMKAGGSNRKKAGTTNDRLSYSPPLTAVVASSSSFKQNLSRQHQPTDTSETRSRSSKVNGTRTWNAASIGKKNIRKSVRDRKNPMVLPYATKHQCALLLVDISGFTKLSTLLDVESLSKAINSYFQMIVNEISSQGGDVLKFAGDAVFAEWQATDNPSIHSSNASDTGSGTGSSVQTYSVAPWHGMALVECVAAAAACGAKIVSNCSDFPVFSNAGNVQGAQIATLNVHCGLGVGEVAGLHVGDDNSRREYLILGDPINQVSIAEQMAQHGEMVASPEAMLILAKKCEFDERVLSTEIGKPAVIASRSACYFSKKQLKRNNRMSSSSSQTSSNSVPPAETLALQCESMDTASLSRLRKLIALYVHPVVVRDDLSSMEQPGTRGTAETRIRAEAELRNVYVTFITPLLEAKITGNKSEDEKLFNLLNGIMILVTRELNRFQGHLRQYIVDDKGIVLIGTFGLRGSTFSNMVTERALPCTSIIHNALRSELGVDNHVGATIGNVYCGVVGGLKRHEFAVLGPSVNLSARLMSADENPGILVDNAVRLKAGKDFGFKALPPVNAKGYTDPVPIFEPLTATERRWGRVKDGFAGRTNEMKIIFRMAKTIAYSVDSPVQMAFVIGETGMGKSSFVVHAVECIRQEIGTGRKSVIVTRNVSNKSDSLVPFSLFRSVFLDILHEIQTIDQYADDDSECGSRAYSRAISSTTSWGQITTSSNDSAETKSALSNGITRLMAMCKEMDAPPEFQEIIKHHLLGFEKEKDNGEDSEVQNKVAPATQSIVKFMARAFIRCTGHAELTVLALDDVHFMDEMSWKVVQELFETGNNILIVCSARPISKFQPNIDGRFWRNLITKQHKEGRFKEIELLPLSQQSIIEMIAKVLGHHEVEIDDRLARDVFMHSGGMPDIASQMLDTIKRRGFAVKLDNGLIGWSQDPNENGVTSDLSAAFASIGDIILHRLDSLDDSVRSVLQLAAVLDTEFSLSEAIKSFGQLHFVKTSDRIKQAKKVSEALEKAVMEGILEESFEGGENDKDDTSSASANASHPHAQENRKFMFSHEVWKTTILKLLLDSRKRDIHRSVALALERQHKEDVAVNYRAMIKLFMHWKASGDSAKASLLALKIGKSFGELGMPRQSLKIYDDTLDMWRSDIVETEDEMVAGFSSQMLESIGESDVENMIRIHIAIGKTLSNTQQGRASVTAYQNALLILRSAPASEGIEDRSIVFPIFSGLFLALKMGGIEQDKDCSYEQDLVRRFVKETKVNGDPIHYARALAMQAEMFGRLGKWDIALETHQRLQAIYDPDEHSAEMCKVYSSDRAGQSFGHSALWLLRKGDVAKALETCRYVIDELMPKMDKKNVHNSTVILFPVAWIMKDHGMAVEARDVIDEYVVKAFRDYFPEDASIFFKSVHKLFLMNLDLAGKEGKDSDGLDEYVEYALKEENMAFSSAMEIASANMGRTMSTLFAEVCACLTERITDYETKIKLVQNGLKSAYNAVEVTMPRDGNQGMIHANLIAEPLARRLDQIARDL